MGGFLGAVVFKEAAWPIFIFAAAIGGISSGLVWTAQGRYFSTNSKIFSIESLRPVEKVNSRFAGIFAFYFLGLECTIRVFAGVLFLTLPNQATYDVVFAIYAIISLFAFYLMLGIDSLEDYGTQHFDSTTIVEDVMSTASLVSQDKRLLFLMPFQVAVGIAFSFVPFYVFGTIIGESDSLGKAYIGLISALIPLTGTVCTVC